MSEPFPYANYITGALIFLVGFCTHWLGQLVSLINWKFAEKLGLQEKGLLPEYRVYEHAIAVADVAIGLIYGVTAVGLFIGAQWGYKLALISGAILIYHAISAWAWEGNRRRAGHQLWSDSLRIGWFAANASTGTMAIVVGWAGNAG